MSMFRKLEIRNIRKLKEVDIEFLGPGLRLIQGPNQAGKSTLAQCILLAMEGPNALTPGMITRGEEQAEIVAYTDDGLQIKTVIQDKVKQTVSRFDDTANKYVAVSGGVRTFLDSIRSGLEMPWAMRDLTDARIIEILKERTGISKKIDEIDAALRDKETARRDVGRDKTKLGKPDPVKEAKHPDPIDEIQAERKKAREYLEWCKRELTEASEHLRTKCLFTSMGDVWNLRSSVDGIITKLQERFSAKEKELGKAYTEEDLNKLEKEFTDWVRKEEAAKAYEAYVKKSAEIKDLGDKYDALTAEIDKLRNERKRVLSDMRLGIKGLEIGENDNLLYHNGNLRGITDTNKVGNWSTAESVQVFFQIAVRFCGELKMLVVDNAESLDDSTTAAISDWAKKNEFLVILLRVASIPSELEDGIIYIKEGEVFTK